MAKIIVIVATHIDLDIRPITTYAASTDSFEAVRGASAFGVVERWLEQSLAVELLAIAIDRKTAALISFDSFEVA